MPMIQRVQERSQQSAGMSLMMSFLLFMYLSSCIGKVNAGELTVNEKVTGGSERRR